jgi:hypothetical protein
VTSLVRGGAWSDERWDELGVIDEAKRTAFVAQVLRLRDGRAECGVPELRGAPEPSSLDSMACKDCPSTLAKQCAELAAPGIGAGYFGVLDEVLDAASGPTATGLSRDVLLRHMMARLRLASGSGLDDLVVGYAGLAASNQRSIIVRLNRGDGVRAELYFEEPDQLRWRTHHRSPKAVSTPSGRLSFLLDAPPQGSSNSRVSGMCLVSRPFWETP